MGKSLHVSNKLNYCSGRIDDMGKKIDVLLCIIQITMGNLDDEATQSKKSFNGGMEATILLCDAISTFKFSGEQLLVFFDLMCNTNNDLKELGDQILKKIESK